MPDKFDLKFAIPDLVEELRDKARSETNDLNRGIPQTAIEIGIPLFSVEEHICWEAADCIETLTANKHSTG